jgi:hypothetical protein
MLPAKNGPDQLENTEEDHDSVNVFRNMNKQMGFGTHGMK